MIAIPKAFVRLSILLVFISLNVSARCKYRQKNVTACSPCTQSVSACATSCAQPLANCCNPCIFNCCNNPPFCGPFPRPLPGDYDSFKDNTRIGFWHLPPCAPRNDSKMKGYLYKGMWWDNMGVRYWAFRNSTTNTITVEALEGGEVKDIPAGDVANINRGESYSFRVQVPAYRFELFSNDAHYLEVFINTKGDIDYRVETQMAKNKFSDKEQEVMPKF
jgi:hypothetical protein